MSNRIRCCDHITVEGVQLQTLLLAQPLLVSHLEKICDPYICIPRKLWLLKASNRRRFVLSPILHSALTDFKSFDTLEGISEPGGFSGALLLDLDNKLKKLVVRAANIALRKV